MAVPPAHYQRERNARNDRSIGQCINRVGINSDVIIDVFRKGWASLNHSQEKRLTAGGEQNLLKVLQLALVGLSVLRYEPRGAQMRTTH